MLEVQIEYDKKGFLNLKQKSMIKHMLEFLGHNIGTTDEKIKPFQWKPYANLLSLTF